MIHFVKVKNFTFKNLNPIWNILSFVPFKVAMHFLIWIALQNGIYLSTTLFPCWKIDTKMKYLYWITFLDQSRFIFWVSIRNEHIYSNMLLCAIIGHGTVTHWLVNQTHEWSQMDHLKIFSWNTTYQLSSVQSTEDGDSTKDGVCE